LSLQVGQYVRSKTTNLRRKGETTYHTWQRTQQCV
jgi:hypothetical protein